MQDPALMLCLPVQAYHFPTHNQINYNTSYAISHISPLATTKQRQTQQTGKWLNRSQEG